MMNERKKTMNELKERISKKIFEKLGYIW